MVLTYVALAMLISIATNLDNMYKATQAQVKSEKAVTKVVVPAPKKGVVRVVASTPTKKLNVHWTSDTETKHESRK